MAVSTDDKKEPTAEQKPASPRQETFLARYQRKYKIGIVVLGLAAVLLLPSVGREVVSLVSMALPAAPVMESNVPKSKWGNQATKEGVEIATGQPAHTAVLSDGIALNEQNDTSIKLEPAPFPSLVQDTSEGALPRIAENGMQPWQAYSRPFNTSDQRPRIALIIAHLGMGRLATDAALNRMPSNVTMLFDVESPDLMNWCAQARQKGHEILLDIPMEPFDYPRSDPGTHSLLTNLANVDNLTRFLWALRQGSGYIGVTTLSGSRFTTAPDKLSPIMEELKRRGLLIVDTRIAPHSAVADLAHNMRVPLVSTTSTLDQNPSPEAIDAALMQLEQSARVNGMAVGLASPYPLTLDRIDIWLKTLAQRGIALAPVSAMVQ